LKKSIANILQALSWLALLVAMGSGLGILFHAVFSIVVARELWGSSKLHIEIVCFAISVPLLILMQLVVYWIRRQSAP